MLTACLPPGAGRRDHPAAGPPVRRRRRDPVQRHRRAAAAVGVELDIEPGVGPVVAEPVRAARGPRAAAAPRARRRAPVVEAVRRSSTSSAATPLIGFAGAPFTLASYLVEGGPSRTHERTKALMYGHPEVWHACSAGSPTITAHLPAAAGGGRRVGGAAVRLVGGRAFARRLPAYVLPHSAAALAAVADLGVPRIHFGVGTGELLGAMGDAGAEVVGVDFRVPLDEAERRVGRGQGAAGQPRPGRGARAVEGHARPGPRVLADAAGLGGHVFNLGHGVLPDTDPDVLPASSSSSTPSPCAPPPDAARGLTPHQAGARTQRGSVRSSSSQ